MGVRLIRLASAVAYGAMDVFCRVADRAGLREMVAEVSL